MTPNILKQKFGNIDIYLFDQLLKGRFNPSMSILDAGCGTGRNVIYFLQNAYSVYGIDKRPELVAYMKRLAAQHQPGAPADRFQVGDIDTMPFEDAYFDAVICSAVLHFSEDEAHFRRMVAEMARVLKPGGILFARLASTIGIETLVQKKEGRWYTLPDGSDRFLVDEALLIEMTNTISGTLLEPIKTTNVQNQRAMTTWVIRR